MAIDVVVPVLGPEHERGTLTEWYRGDGEAIRAGELVCRLEAGTIALDVEAERDGILRHLGSTGVIAPWGSVAGVILAPGESFDDGEFADDEPADAFAGATGAVRGSNVIVLHPERSWLDATPGDAEEDDDGTGASWLDTASDDQPTARLGWWRQDEPGDARHGEQAGEIPEADEPIAWDFSPPEEAAGGSAAEAPDAPVSASTGTFDWQVSDAWERADGAVAEPTAWWESAGPDRDDSPPEAPIAFEEEPTAGWASDAPVAAAPAPNARSEPWDDASGELSGLAIDLAPPPGVLEEPAPAEDDADSGAPAWWQQPDAADTMDAAPSAAADASPGTAAWWQEPEPDEPADAAPALDEEDEDARNDLLAFEAEALDDVLAFETDDAGPVAYEAECVIDEDAPAAPPSLFAPAPLTMKVTIAMGEARRACDHATREWRGAPIAPLESDVVLAAIVRATSEAGLDPRDGMSGACLVRQRDAGDRLLVFPGGADIPLATVVEARQAEFEAAPGECSSALLDLGPWGIDEGVAPLGDGLVCSFALGAVRVITGVAGGRPVTAPVATLTLAYAPGALAPLAAATLLARIRDLVEVPETLLAA